MDSMRNQSEVARFMRQVTREHEAGLQGLMGLASVSSHECINARMKRNAEHILELIHAGKHEEAQALLCTETWGAEEIV
ncbi:MAG: hypothetical protein NVS2B12_25320 [Ktedonobacteraceae bacterium]